MCPHLLSNHPPRQRSSSSQRERKQTRVASRLVQRCLAVSLLLGARGPPKNGNSHVDAPPSRQPLTKGEKLVRLDVDAVLVCRECPPSITSVLQRQQLPQPRLQPQCSASVHSMACRAATPAANGPLAMVGWGCARKPPVVRPGVDPFTPHSRSNRARDGEGHGLEVDMRPVFCSLSQRLGKRGSTRALTDRAGLGVPGVAAAPIFVPRRGPSKDFSPKGQSDNDAGFAFCSRLL